jgi:anti-anti-sigma factor
VGEPPTERSKPRIDVEENGGTSVITLTGEHDVSTRRYLEDQIQQVCGAGGSAIVDLSHATFVDSTIISVLAVAHERGCRIALVAPPRYEGTRLVELIGIGRVIRSYPSRAAAIAAWETDSEKGPGTDSLLPPSPRDAGQ